MSSPPQPPPAKILTDISPAAWEHPADRAALMALRALPGFDSAMKKVLGFIGGEQGIRLIFQANSVRVGPDQFPRLHGLMKDVTKTLDWREDVELYVSQTPTACAMSVGFNRPFIVVKSDTLSLLGEGEQRVVLGHELGHIMSGHALYQTMLYLTTLVGVAGLPFLTGVALIPIRLALMEWYRKSELSSDRAGLLASQSRQDALGVFLRLAGGAAPLEQASLEPFLRQAREYAESGGPIETVYKILNSLDLTHPFSTMRAAELSRWIEEGQFDRIVVDGQYPRRGNQESERRLTADVADAAKYYGREAKETAGHMYGAARRATEALTQALFKNRGE